MNNDNGAGKASAGGGDAPNTPASQSQRAASKEWWYTRNGTKFGPVSEAVLRQLAKRGTLMPDDLVWTAGMNEWQPARAHPWLFPPSAEGSTPPPTPFDRSGSGDTRSPGETRLVLSIAQEGAAGANSPSVQVVPGTGANTAGRAAWVLLIIAWVAFLVPLPGTGLFVGWPANLVAFVLSIVAIAQRGTKAGIFQLLSSLVVSPFVYLFGSFLFALMFFSSVNTGA